MTNAAALPLFQVLDETATVLQKELEISYLEAIYETCENLFQNEILQEKELSESENKLLKSKYATIQLNDLEPEEIRKSFQLALIKGMKSGVQANRQMTPDSIGFIMAYLVEKVIDEKKTVSILDPACGTANLLSTVINRLEEGKKRSVNATGVEVDDLLVSLALVSSDLQRQKTNLFHQDGLSRLLVDPVDVVISDLPFGYYPDDENAKNFVLNRIEGHSFAHFLFIEQSFYYTKPGGYLFFLVPEAMFISDEYSKLNRLIKKEGYTRGIIKLPETLFKSEKTRKNILILQKKADFVTAKKEVLLVHFPTLTDPRTTAPIIAKIEKWFEENKNEGK